MALWSDERAKDACLRMQDRNAKRADVDVNILLFCVWAAANGYGDLSAGEIMGAIGATKPWRQHVVLPLRATRRSLTNGVDPVPPALGAGLLAALREAELEAERVEQLMLEHLVDVPTGREVATETAATAAAASFARYFSRLGITPAEADTRDMGQLLAVALPGTGGGDEPVER